MQANEARSNRERHAGSRPRARSRKGVPLPSRVAIAASSSFAPGPSRMKIYAFEDIDEGLKLLPLAARRALDAVGSKVSLADWQVLSQAVRRELVELGSGDRVDVARVSELLQHANVPRQPLEPRPEPPTNAVPEAVEALCSLPLGAWLALSPLDRYALLKLTARGQGERWQRAVAEIVGATAASSHLGPAGEVRMVDVSAKQATLRRAVAVSAVSMNEQAMRALEVGNAKKGDVLAAARLAGIMAAKRTSDLIPLCHPLSLTHCEVHVKPVPGQQRVSVRASVEVVARTGVEMEAMVAATTAALTVYDMLKGVDRSMTVGPTMLMEKTGGKSGDFKR